MVFNYENTFSKRNSFQYMEWSTRNNGFPLKDWLSLNEMASFERNGFLCNETLILKVMTHTKTNGLY